MTIAIIGGAGRMGQWFARFLLKEGMEVILADLDTDKLKQVGQRLQVDIAGNTGDISQADVVLFAVSIDGFESAISEYAPYIRPEQIVVDITSVKVMPVTVMHKYFKDNLILGTHPMFGPGIRSISGRNFVLTPTSEKENVLAQKVKEYLSSRGAGVTVMQPAEHDEIMSVVLGLSHFIALVAADTLSDIKDLKNLDSVSGLTCKKLLTLIDSVLSQDPALYAAIQVSLDSLPQIEKQFRDKAGVWADIVKNKDKEQFIKRMNRLKEHFGKI
jgi:prephenate dehydrogenase